MKNLEQLRIAINKTNDELLKLLNERAAIAQEIGEVKKTDQLPVYQPERELAVLDEIVLKNPGPLSNDQIKTIMQVVMQECRAVQLTKPLNAAHQETIALPLKTQGSVAYLGPVGTFTYQAVMKCFGAEVQGVPLTTMTEVIHKVAMGEVAHGVVAIENSSEGVVNEAMDALIATGVTIRGEVRLAINFNLLVKNDDQVKVIYAHPQALAQCRGNLVKFYPDAKQVAVSSNAEAARLAEIEVGAASLGSEVLQQAYHLAVKQAHMEDLAHNETRFLILGAALQKSYPASKVTLVADLRYNSAGQLDKILRVFAAKRLDMTLLETRPNKVSPWQYVFVFDVLADAEDVQFQEAMVELNTIAKVSVLGSYPILN